MSTPTHRLLVIAAAAAAACGGLHAQPKLGSNDREQQLLGQIAEWRAKDGPTPKELVEPLRALALLYEEAEQPVAAITALEEARHVTRVHQGLASADEALLLRQQVRSEKALGLHERAWDHEQDMVTIARQHHEDTRMLPIFRELADDRLEAIEQVRNSERPPMVYAGCYNGAPLPPYDYTRGGEWREEVQSASGFVTSTCIGGINQYLIAKLSSEILMYYADAIETILRTGDYASPELRQLERAAVRIYSRRLTALSGKGDGSFVLCRSGTLDDFLALEILGSCLAPVGRGPGYVVANVGNPPALLRVIQYEIRSAAPAAARANAMADLADWYVRFVRPDRRRFDMPKVTFALYERAYRELTQSGDLKASTEMFAPELPITLPTYDENPLASAAESPRYLDVSFAITRYGIGERIAILDTSKNATREEKQELTRLIESTSFRPRTMNGKIADEAPVTLRYYLH